MVSEAVLTVCIGEIRQALGDDRQTPCYIETVHRRGYRFIGTISTAPEPDSVLGFEAAPEAPPRRQMTHSQFPLGTQHSALDPASLVGRETELAQLQGWLDQARRGVRQVVFVAGEAGMGKTTLVDAFLARVTAETPLWLTRGQCIAHHGAGEAYLPMLDALGRLCRRPGSESLLAWPESTCADVARADAGAARRGRAGGPAA